MDFFAKDFGKLEFPDNPESIFDLPTGLTEPSLPAGEVSQFEQSLAKAPQTKIYKEHCFPVARQPEESPSWLIELAQWPVPWGSIGFLKDLNQVLYDGSELIEEVIPPIAGMLWTIRLEPFYGRLPNRINFSPAVLGQLPGSRTDLPDWDYQWFRGQNTETPLHLVVQGGTLLRFFFFTPAVPGAEYRWRVLGRLRGFYQSLTENHSAVENAREW